MDETRVILAGLWVAVMLTYLLGDVLRIFAGHAEPGKMGDTTATQGMWLLAAVVMLVPIVMLVLTLIVDHGLVRWLNIVAAGFLVVFNLVGLSYKGAYDYLLLFVTFGFNALTMWYAWNWTLYA